MRQRYSAWVIPIIAFAAVGTLSWGYSATQGSARLAVHRAHFRALTPDTPEYRAFYNNYQAFNRQGKEKGEQRDRLREIRRRVESDPQSRVLKETLMTYHAWLKTVTGEKGDKSKIDQAETLEQRLEVIRVLKENQDRLRGQVSSGRRIAERDPDFSPTMYDLGEYLESLDQELLETLLGHTPSHFLFRLDRDYHSTE